MNTKFFSISKVGMKNIEKNGYLKCKHAQAMSVELRKCRFDGAKNFKLKKKSALKSNNSKTPTNGALEQVFRIFNHRKESVLRELSRQKETDRRSKKTEIFLFAKTGPGRIRTTSL